MNLDIFGWIVVAERLRLIDDFGNSHCKHSDNQKIGKIARFVFANQRFLVEMIDIAEIETVAVGNSVKIDIDDSLAGKKIVFFGDQFAGAVVDGVSI